MCHDLLDAFECCFLGIRSFGLDFVGCNASQWLNFMRAMVPIFL